ncbi:hypothetical protein I6M38_06350 [Shewanella algae]|uniref:hypothetical protein n=1 Tax=Shewanella algae TaxID=38313 RepID=UPI001AADF151|nr:hypothetical protein [Shewanella algae]MBO2551600.1 hypothetical protein [Shewanella algae]
MKQQKRHSLSGVFVYIIPADFSHGLTRFLRQTALSLSLYANSWLNLKLLCLSIKSQNMKIPQAVTGLTPIPLRELDIDGGQSLSTAVKKPFGFEAAVIDFFMTQELFWVRD